MWHKNNLKLSVTGVLRQAVNAFCRQKATDMKMRVMTRLQNITYIQTLLERALAGVHFIQYHWEVSESPCYDLWFQGFE